MLWDIKMMFLGVCVCMFRLRIALNVRGREPRGDYDVGRRGNTYTYIHTNSCRILQDLLNVRDCCSHNVSRSLPRPRCLRHRLGVSSCQGQRHAGAQEGEKVDQN